MGHGHLVEVKFQDRLMAGEWRISARRRLTVRCVALFIQGFWLLSMASDGSDFSITRGLPFIAILHRGCIMLQCSAPLPTSAHCIAAWLRRRMHRRFAKCQSASSVTLPSVLYRERKLHLLCLQDWTTAQEDVPVIASLLPRDLVWS